MLLRLSPCSVVIDSNIWTLLVAPELANLEGAEEEDPELLTDSQSWLDGGSEHELQEDTQAGPKRRARQLTEEDLPVNDYVSEGTTPWGALAMGWGALATALGYLGHGPRVSSLCSLGWPVHALGVSPCS